MKNNLSEEEEDKVISAYLSGESALKISRLNPISQTGVFGLLKRRGVEIRGRSSASRKYSLNESYFNNIDSQNKAYFLGFLYADGYNNVKRSCVELSCASKDKEVLEYLNCEIESNKPIRLVESKGVKSCRIDWCSKKLCTDLKRLGCVQNKTFKIKMPDIGKNLVRDFIRGYFDGDGCISYSVIEKDNSLGSILNGVVTIVGTESFCNSIRQIIKDELEVNTSLLCRNPERDNNIRTIQLAGNQQVIKFMNWIYKDANLYMNRKYEKFLSLQEVLKERKLKLEEINEKKKSLLKLSEIVKGSEETWKARYWITHGLVVHEGRSRFTYEQAKILREKLDNYSDKEVIQDKEINDIFTKYRKMGFPFPEHSFENFKKGFCTLEKSKIQKKNDTYSWDGYGTQFATCFHPHIFNCSRKNKLSAYELFYDDDLFKVAIKKVISLKKTVLDSSIRDICRNDNSSSRINNFPPRVAISILHDTFNSPITVLDPCAGFSGRLIGCAASKLVNRYVGIDLSLKTYNGLKKTKQWLHRYGSIMDVELKHGDCIKEMGSYKDIDCILTSPPFLDVERYDGVPYETDYDKWLEDFVTPFIKSSFYCLKSGGRMFLYLEKIGKIDFPNDVSIIAESVGFSIKDPVLFKMSYGENNRSKATFRGISILSFLKN
jgi:hypothetical protein